MPSTPPSPARRSIPTPSKYQKVEFKNIDKDKAEFRKDCHQWLRGHGAALLCQRLVAGRWRRNATTYARKVGDNLYAAGMITPVGTLQPGETKAVDARLFAGPQVETTLEALAPGLELVKDYGWLTILAKPLYWLLDKIHGFLGNWGWSIVGLVLLLKICLLLAQRQGLRQHGQDEGHQPQDHGDARAPEGQARSRCSRR